jgi:hypothetical protein
MIKSRTSVGMLAFKYRDPMAYTVFMAMNPKYVQSYGASCHEQQYCQLEYPTFTMDISSLEYRNGK